MLCSTTGQDPDALLVMASDSDIIDAVIVWLCAMLPPSKYTLKCQRA